MVVICVEYDYIEKCFVKSFCKIVIPYKEIVETTFVYKNSCIWMFYAGEKQTKAGAEKNYFQHMEKSILCAIYLFKKIYFSQLITIDSMVFDPMLDSVLLLTL